MADTLSVLKYYLYYKYKKRFSDRSALERWQVQKIRKHLEYVGEHSRLYKGMKKLSSYPVIDKKFMMEHFDELNTVGIGREEALDTLESFADKYPHQVAAVKAEVAYFNLDYEKALALDLTILPWLEEWYYSNVSDEHMIAMTVAAIRLHREQELIEALTKEQTRIRAENGLPQRDRFCDILMDYLKRGVMPFADNDKNYPYHEPEEPQTKEQLWAKLVEQNKKLSPDDPDARRKLYNHCCMFGTARDAVDLFEEIQGVPMADSSYRDAIARYLYLGQREKALQTAERLATSRLWAVAGPTQVRPMSFFEDPNLREFLLEPESLRRIREAAFIDDGSLIRK